MFKLSSLWKCFPSEELCRGEHLSLFAFFGVVNQIWQDSFLVEINLIETNKQKPPKSKANTHLCFSGSESNLYSKGDMPGKYLEVTVLLTLSPNFKIKYSSVPNSSFHLTSWELSHLAATFIRFI